MKEQIGDNMREVEFWTECYRISEKVRAQRGAGGHRGLCDVLDKANRTHIPVTERW